MGHKNTFTNIFKGDFYITIGEIDFIIWPNN